MLKIKYILFYSWTSLVAQTVKHLSTMWETRVRSLGWEDPLEKEMAIHFRTIAWKIPWTEEPGRLQSMESQRVGHDWATSLHFTTLNCGSAGKESSCNVGTWVWSLDWEDPLEKEIEIHSRTIAWRIPWTEEPAGLQSMGSQRVAHSWATLFFFVYVLVIVNNAAMKLEYMYLFELLFGRKSF